MNDYLYSKTDLKEIFKDKCIIRNEKPIKQVIIDSRKCIDNSLFVVIKGDNFDGHEFIKDAVCNGATSIVVSHISDEINTFLEEHNVNVFFIEDTVNALAMLARYNRERLKAKVIAITGNVGKTSTRNIVSSVASAFSKTVSTSGNLNNHIGMPLTLANVLNDTEIVVLELGMNHIGEIKYLSKIAKPDISIITNIVPVHMEFMGSIENIIKAKAEIFDGMNENGIVILNKSNEYFFELKKLAEKANIKNIISVGSNDSDIFIRDFCCLPDFKIKYNVCFSKKQDIVNCIASGFTYPNAFNSLFGFAVAEALNLDINIAKQAIQKIEPVKGRGNLEKYFIDNHSVFVINDAYNSSPEALCEGLKGFVGFCKSNNISQSIVVIGDMLELGDKSAEYHENVAYFIEDLLKTSNIDDIIFIGNETRVMYNTLNNKKNKTSFHWFENTDLFVEKIKHLDLFSKDCCLYLKASRGMHFEKITETLSSV